MRRVLPLLVGLAVVVGVAGCIGPEKEFLRNHRWDEYSDEQLVNIGRDLCRGMEEMGADEYLQSLLAGYDHEAGLYRVDFSGIRALEPDMLTSLLFSACARHSLCPEHADALDEYWDRLQSPSR
jgi:hypothetical protein